jgi:hypothetical protein
MGGMQGAWYTRRRVTATGLVGLALAAGIVMWLGAGADATPKASVAKRATIASKTFTMTDANQRTRFTVTCPGKKIPFGGGMFGTPNPGPAGEGAYPHSYERLGVQHGYHVSAVNYDPSQGNPTSHNVTLQVACGSKLGPMKSPHTTLDVASGEVKTAIAKCPGKRHLIGGGFQRTNFTSRGGDYVTESRAISGKAWSVTGTAFGGFGGELTAIAYCQPGKGPQLSSVSNSTEVQPGQYASTTTPPCPGRKTLVFGGFSTMPTGSTFFADGFFSPGGGWTSGGYNRFGPAAMLTAYGYCLSV